MFPLHGNLGWCIVYILFLQNVNLHESEKQETPPLAVTEESKNKAII